jgi:hypothetical protein
MNQINKTNQINQTNHATDRVLLLKMAMPAGILCHTHAATQSPEKTDLRFGE